MSEEEAIILLMDYTKERDGIDEYTAVIRATLYVQKYFSEAR